MSGERSTPSVGVHSLAGNSPGPVRMCIGCRQRVPATDLLRVVVVSGAVIADPQRRLPGRGVNLHPDVECLNVAERRRAFTRAFRVDGPLDLSAIRDAVNRSQAPSDRSASSRSGEPSSAQADRE